MSRPSSLRPSPGPYPLGLLIHGTGQTAMNWTDDARTAGRAGPDGSPRRGWQVYTIDQAGAGVGPAWQAPGVDGGAEAASGSRSWKSGFHGRCPGAGAGGRPGCTRKWPGRRGQGGHPGDPGPFDQFYASQVASLEQHRERGADAPGRPPRCSTEIGPAVLMVHSQAGPFFGWLIADERPHPRQRHRGPRARAVPPYKDAVFESGRRPALGA